MRPRFILIAGNRVVGKDTFCYALRSELAKSNKNSVRIAFADSLKDMLEPTCKQLFNKNIGELLPFEKEMFRPVLLAVGKLARELDLDFWVKKALEKVNQYDCTYVFTDVRYKNEYEYLTQKFPGQCHLIWLDRIGAPVPTSEELVNGPLLKAFADSTIEWPTFGKENINKAIPYVLDWMKKVNL